MHKTILVTGAAGFIGSSLIDQLLLQGHTVIGVDNFNDFYSTEIKINNLQEYFSSQELQELIAKIKSPFRNFQKFSLADLGQGFSTNSVDNFLQNKNYFLYGVDLCDYQSVNNIFQKHLITHVVHLAALAGVRPSTEKPILYERNNGSSTINILSLASEYKIQKIVFASSSSVYGASNQVPFHENQDILKPISPYAATKVSGEAYAHAFYNLYKIPTVCLRFFTVYGPRQRPDLAIHKFASLILAAKNIEVYGDGSAKRDFTYIEDILDGVLKSLDYNCGFEVFNLGESQTNDVKTLIQLLEENLHKKANVLYKEPIPGDVPITYADISKSKSLLGYNPVTKLDLGIKKFTSWLIKSKTLA